MSGSRKSYLDVLIEAVNALDEKKGASLVAIKKYLFEFYNIDVKKNNTRLKNVLKKAVEEGKLTRESNTGSFKVAVKSRRPTALRGEKSITEKTETTGVTLKSALVKQPVAKMCASVFPAKPIMKPIRMTTQTRGARRRTSEPLAKIGNREVMKVKMNRTISTASPTKSRKSTALKVTFAKEVKVAADTSDTVRKQPERKAKAINVNPEGVSKSNKGRVTKSSSPKRVPEKPVANRKSPQPKPETRASRKVPAKTFATPSSPMKRREVTKMSARIKATKSPNENSRAEASTQVVKSQSVNTRAHAKSLTENMKSPSTSTAKKSSTENLKTIRTRSTAKKSSQIAKSPSPGANKSSTRNMKSPSTRQKSSTQNSKSPNTRQKSSTPISKSPSVRQKSSSPISKSPSIRPKSSTQNSKLPKWASPTVSTPEVPEDLPDSDTGRPLVDGLSDADTDPPLESDLSDYDTDQSLETDLSDSDADNSFEGLGGDIQCPIF